MVSHRIAAHHALSLPCGICARVGELLVADKGYTRAADFTTPLSRGCQKHVVACSPPTLVRMEQEQTQQSVLTGHMSAQAPAGLATTYHLCHTCFWLAASPDGTKHSTHSSRTSGSSALFAPHHRKAVTAYLILPVGPTPAAESLTARMKLSLGFAHLSKPASTGWRPGTPNFIFPFRAWPAGAPTGLLRDRRQLSFTYRHFLSCHKEEDVRGGVK